MYHGYPHEDTLWIGMFVIDGKERRKGVGKEVMEALCSYGKGKGWKKIGLGVYLKNWTGLRFWISLGFTGIIGIYGDQAYREDTFSFLGLEKDLYPSVSPFSAA